MRESIQLAWLWLRRIAYCRGFGIQSPWAYEFVRYVVNEHYPYYAYAQFDATYANQKKTWRKMGKLLFRLANYWQPDVVTLPSPAFAPFLSAGRKKSCMILETEKVSKGRRRMAVADYGAESEQDIEQMLNEADENQLLVCLNIAQDESHRKMWRYIVNDSRTGITFDLHHCGIAFFDLQRHKRGYRINF